MLTAEARWAACYGRVGRVGTDPRWRPRSCRDRQRRATLSVAVYLSRLAFQVEGNAERHQRSWRALRPRCGYVAQRTSRDTVAGIASWLRRGLVDLALVLIATIFRRMFTRFA